MTTTSNLAANVTTTKYVAPSVKVLGTDVYKRQPLDGSYLTDPERRLLGALAWVQRAWLLDPTCLRRALASGWVLRRHKPHLCLGLTGTHDVLAHAWLVLEGRSLDGLPGAPVFKRGDRREAGACLLYTSAPSGPWRCSRGLQGNTSRSLGRAPPRGLAPG